MRANSFENLIADQKFKIQPADDQFMEYMKDCNVELKICNSCQVGKELKEFGLDKYQKSGLNIKCKQCCRKYYSENRKELSEKNKERYRSLSSDKKKRLNKERYDKNKESIKQYSKKWNLKNKEYVSIKNKEYRQNNPEKYSKYIVDNKEKLKLWVLNNPDKVKQYRLNYKNSKAKKIRLERDHEKIKEYDRIYIAKKRKEDPLFRMLSNIRSRTSHEFRKISSSKNSTTINLLGVNQDILKKYIERKFTKGMNWNNYGEWHIDHKIPLSSAENKSDLKKLMHYTNLQPLWAFDNMSKGSDQVEHQIKLRI